MLEGRGVPSLVLGTDAFLSLAQAQSATHGLPHLAVVLVPHPVGGIDPVLVAAKAEKIAAEALCALTRDPAPPAGVAASIAASVVDGPDDLDAFQSWAMDALWSDGLPVLPPTAERVERMLGRHADRRAEIVATLAPRAGRATREAIAINAVLAGAAPEHLPVVVAAIRALAEPRFNLNAIQTTTHPCTPLIIVNGPIAPRLGISGGPNALGNGARANAVIGRAVRLTLQNVGGARPGLEDRATLGHAGKFSYCLAENEAASPWPSLAAERGVPAGESCVTVCGSEAPHNVNDHASTTAEALLRAIASVGATTANNNVYLDGEPLVILGPEHAATLAGSGWSKADFKRRLWEQTHVRLGRFSAENLARFATIAPERFLDRPSDAEVPWCVNPEDLMVIVAGGPGKHSAVIPTFGATRSVTLPVED
jgi:hypothetical protein